MQSSHRCASSINFNLVGASPSRSPRGRFHIRCPSDAVSLRHLSLIHLRSRHDKQSHHDMHPPASEHFLVPSVTPTATLMTTEDTQPSTSVLCMGQSLMMFFFFLVVRSQRILHLPHSISLCIPPHSPSPLNQPTSSQPPSDLKKGVNKRGVQSFIRVDSSTPANYAVEHMPEHPVLII